MTPSGPTDWDTLPDVLRMEQAAAILGIGRNLAYEAAAQGASWAIKIRGRWIVPKAQLQRFLGIDPTPEPPLHARPATAPVSLPASPRRDRRPRGSHLRLAPGGVSRPVRKEAQRG